MSKLSSLLSTFYACSFMFLVHIIAKLVKQLLRHGWLGLQVLGLGWLGQGMPEL
jgi:hypothetical protein